MPVDSSVYILISSRYKIDVNSANNAEFTVGSKSISTAPSVAAVTPVLVTFTDTFTTTPSIVYVEMNNFVNGQMITGLSGLSQNILCSVPMTQTSTGHTIVWEPQDFNLHTVQSPRPVSTGVSTKVRLLDQDLNPLVTTGNSHVDIILNVHQAQ